MTSAFGPTAGTPALGGRTCQGPSVVYVDGGFVLEWKLGLVGKRYGGASFAGRDAGAGSE